jgi:2-alkenal reductase
MYRVTRDDNDGWEDADRRPTPPRRQGPRLVPLLVAVVLLSAIMGGLAGGAAGFLAARATAVETPVVKQPAPPAPAVDQPVAEREVPVTEREVVQEESATIAAVQRVQPAVVTVLNQGRFGLASGSGLIIRPDGYIVTNNHVVEGAQQLGVIFHDGRQAEARLIGTFELTDLAVIQVDEPAPAVAELGDSDALQPGARVIAIGSALGQFQNTVTTGIVSALNRRIGELDGLVQTDAPINQGNSGGPLVNSAGQVVGINTLVVRGGRSEAEGLGFAVPSNTVRAVAEQLIASGRVERPYLGIRFRPVDPDQAGDLGLKVGEGIIVEEVEAGSPVAQAGLQAGDVIVNIGGYALDANTSLLNLMLRFRAGQQVGVGIVRDGQADTLQVTLGAFSASG